MSLSCTPHPLHHLLLFLGQVRREREVHTAGRTSSEDNGPLLFTGIASSCARFLHSAMTTYAVILVPLSSCVPGLGARQTKLNDKHSAYERSCQVSQLLG